MNLRHLELQDNGVLEAIPATYGSLVSLRYFNISNTAVPSIPTEVKYWTQLLDLVAARNTQFEALPGTPGSHRP